jgi:hypothetical protein
VKKSVVVEMKKFIVEMTVRAEISISETLLKDVLRDDWRKDFYQLMTPADVAEHLAYNLCKGRSLSFLDGFANQNETEVRYDDDWTIDTVTEVPESPDPATPTNRSSSASVQANLDEATGRLTVAIVGYANNGPVQAVTDATRSLTRAAIAVGRNRERKARPQSRRGRMVKPKND